MGLWDWMVPDFTTGRGMRDTVVTDTCVSSVNPTTTGTGGSSTAGSARCVDGIGGDVARGATTVNLAVPDGALIEDTRLLEGLVSCWVAEGRRRALACGAGVEAEDLALVEAGDDAETAGDRGGRRKLLGEDLFVPRVGVDAWVW